MKLSSFLLLCWCSCATALNAQDVEQSATGPEIQSMSVLTFSPDGTLFVADSRAGKIFALDLNDTEVNNADESFVLEDIESALGSLLGTGSKGVIIHDFAVNPLSQNIYLAVSRSDATQLGFWKGPNDIGDATILLRLSPLGEFEEVKLPSVKYTAADVPSVVEAGEQNWRKSDKRTEAITDLAYDPEQGKLYVAGLSNEEFASALRVMNYPFTKENTSTTLEVWHIAHGESETEAPIRTLIPYSISGEPHILASYTCTPFVTIPVGALADGKHVKVKTIAEFGYGNMPIDIITYTTRDKEYLLMSNSSKPLIRIDPALIVGQEHIPDALPEGGYTMGLPHDLFSAVGVTHIDRYNATHILALQRMPNGNLNLRSYNTKWM